MVPSAVKLPLISTVKFEDDVVLLQETVRSGVGKLGVGVGIGVGVGVGIGVGVGVGVGVALGVGCGVFWFG